ncbi:MAG: alpha/beta hydrolase [bacterium]|nr:alpha/beta hydrolase [bacterium]
MTVFHGALPGGATEPQPRIEWFPAHDNARGIGLVVFPGGAYCGHAPHEGREYAEWFQQHGITCFLTDYRLGSNGHRHPAMLEDAAAAINTVRSRAGEFGIAPDRIGAIGSSAGGHLLASLLTLGPRYFPGVACRPDFAVLCYPVITMGEFTHAGSRDALLGAPATPAACAELSCELQTHAGMPPCFIWHTWDDAAVPVENSLQFAAALRRAGVPCELHVYRSGAHGLGLKTEYPWAQACVTWLQAVTRAGGTSRS